jgi:hypothetical protein
MDRLGRRIGSNRLINPGGRNGKVDTPVPARSDKAVIPELTAQQKRLVLFADRFNRGRGVVAGHLTTMRSCVEKGVATWTIEGGAVRLTPLGIAFAKQYRR